MSSNPIILDFHDSLVKKSDLALLQYPNWLNDTLIGFIFEYIERVTFKDSSTKIAFISPDTVQFMKLGMTDDIGPCIEPLGLASKDFIFFPINDNKDTESTGGSHWSLLLFNRQEQLFQHFDSYGGSNNKDADMVSKVCKKHVGCPSARFVESPCPQQVNGCDCGMYVVCIAQLLCKKLLKGEAADVAGDITPAQVKSKRKDWFDIIMDLSAKTKS